MELNEKIVETSYYNGKIYKEITKKGQSNPTAFNHHDDVISEYGFLDVENEIFPLYSVKKHKDGVEKIKYYKASNDIYKVMSGDINCKRGFDLSGYDLAPMTTLWVGVGVYKYDKSNYDIFFCVEDETELKQISDYYNLKYPLPDNVSLDDDWNSRDFKSSSARMGFKIHEKFNNNFKLGSIKFLDNKPKILKMYKSTYGEI